MRILYLAHRIPYPPNKGDKIRAFHEIKGLAERGHEVHVLAFADDPDDLRHVHALREYCATGEAIGLDTRLAKARSVIALAGREALSLAYFRHPVMAEAVSRRLEGTPPQACVVYSSPMAQYVPVELKARTLVDMVDVDSEKWRDYAASHAWPMSVVYGVEARRLRALEVSLVREFGWTVLATEREAAILRRDLDGAAARRLSALVNGVDLEFYHPARRPAPDAVPEEERRFLDGNGPCVVFTGAMDYYANVDGVTWFVRDVWPAIRQSHSEATFLIVGARPTAAVRALEQVPGVRVTGFVADIRPYLWAADVCVAPLRIARGVQNKVLEACACGRALVATREAIAGLSIRPDAEVVVADRAPEMAVTVGALLDEPDRAMSLGVAARRFAEREHMWPAMLERFGALVESVAHAAEA